MNSFNNVIIYYVFISQRPLPVKWMAIESLKEESLCTHKSDMLVCVHI